MPAQCSPGFTLCLPSLPQPISSLVIQYKPSLSSVALPPTEACSIWYPRMEWRPGRGAASPTGTNAANGTSLLLCVGTMGPKELNPLDRGHFRTMTSPHPLPSLHGNVWVKEILVFSSLCESGDPGSPKFLPTRCQ